MDFVSTQDFGSEAERLLWESVKAAFATTEPGYCWHRYPITSRSGPRLEPDILILPMTLSARSEVELDP